MLHIVVCALLLSLAVLGYYSLHVFSENNGLFQTVAEHQKQGLLSDGVTVYSPNFTGIESADNLLNLLLLFFWPTVSGDYTEVSLTAFLFVTQGLSAYTLIVLEGLRNGNAGRLISYTLIFSLMFQTLGIAFVGPLYLLIHLITSKPHDKLTANDVSIPANDVKLLPYSLTLGYVLPTVLMTLPYPKVFNLSQKITVILCWQAFPIWTTLFQSILRSMFRTPKGTTSGPSALRSWKNVYRLAWSTSAGGHILTFTLLALQLNNVSPLKQRGWTDVNSRQFLLPAIPFSSTQISTIADGALRFLQWDYLIASMAFMSWACYLKYSALSRVATLQLVYDMILQPVLFGPMATAITLVYDRDEVLVAGRHKKQI